MERGLTCESHARRIRYLFLCEVDQEFFLHTHTHTLLAVFFFPLARTRADIRSGHREVGRTLTRTDGEK